MKRVFIFENEYLGSRFLLAYDLKQARKKIKRDMKERYAVGDNGVWKIRYISRKMAWL